MLGRLRFNKKELREDCLSTCFNVINKKIYGHGQYDAKELLIREPTDYHLCNGIDFVDISKSRRLSEIKSLFLTANRLPNIVQYDRINSDKDKNIENQGLNDDVFENHEELFRGD